MKRVKVTKFCKSIKEKEDKNADESRNELV
jgi:hypothetical protein